MRTLMNIYILRHGETKESREQALYDTKRIKDAPILDESKPVIKKMAKYLMDIETDYNVSSPYLRCKQTAKIIEEIANKEFEYDDRIKESLLITDQETYSDFLSRIKDFLQDIRKKKVESVLICTHGAVIAVLKHLILEGELKQEQMVDFPKTSVLTMIKDNKLYEKNFG